MEKGQCAYVSCSVWPTVLIRGSLTLIQGFLKKYNKALHTEHDLGTSAVHQTFAVLTPQVFFFFGIQILDIVHLLKCQFTQIIFICYTDILSFDSNDIRLQILWV